MQDERDKRNQDYEEEKTREQNEEKIKKCREFGEQIGLDCLTR